MNAQPDTLDPRPTVIETSTSADFERICTGAKLGHWLIRSLAASARNGRYKFTISYPETHDHNAI